MRTSLSDLPNSSPHPCLLDSKQAPRSLAHFSNYQIEQTARSHSASSSSCLEMEWLCMTLSSCWRRRKPRHRCHMALNQIQTLVLAGPQQRPESPSQLSNAWKPRRTIVRVRGRRNGVISWPSYSASIIRYCHQHRMFEDQHQRLPIERGWQRGLASRVVPITFCGSSRPMPVEQTSI